MFVADDDLETAEMLFKRNKIRHIPVVAEEVIIGMLSYTDLLRISFADAVYETEEEVDTLVYNMFTIDQVMAKNVVTVPSTATIKEVAKILSPEQIVKWDQIKEKNKNKGGAPGCAEIQQYV